MVFMSDLNTRRRVLLLVTILTASALAYNLNQTNGSNVMAIKTTNAQTVSEAPAKPNPLLARWEGPYGGPEVLQRFALHYQTGKPIPQALVDRIKRATTFNEGFITVEYLAAALVDMKLHLAGGQKIDPDAFEKATLAELGMPNEIVMRHRTPQFMHVFSSDGYSAGYYSYLWADVLTADAYGAFVEAGGPYDHKVAERLRKYIFSVGNTVDPAEAYRSFRGRDPRVEALMKKRGLSDTHSKSGSSGWSKPGDTHD